MDTIKFVCRRTKLGPQTDVYRNGEIIPDVLSADCQPGLKGGYTVTLGYFEGKEDVFYVDAMEVVEASP